MISNLRTNNRVCILCRLVCEVATVLGDNYRTDNNGDDSGKNASKKGKIAPNNNPNNSRCYISEAPHAGCSWLDVWQRHIIEFWNHDSAGGTKELPIALTSLIGTLKLVVTFCDALAALIAKINQTLGAAIRLRVYPPTTRRAFGLVSNSSHIIWCGLGA
jgi:hypothetical protein